MATYRGHVSKKLSGIALSGDSVPSHGDIVTRDGKDIGVVTSGLRSPTLGSVIALAYIKHGLFDPGSGVEVQIGDQLIPAVVVNLPFYSRA